MAAGLFPDAVYEARSSARSAALPALHTLAIAQAAFLLTLYPAMLYARRRTSCGLNVLSLVELVGFAVTACPFYATATYLGDAVATDAFRAGLAVLAVVPLSLAAGLLPSTPAARASSLLVILVVFAGLPVCWYVSADFLSGAGSSTLWRLSPSFFVWAAAGARQGHLLPKPIWAWLAWPGVAAGWWVVAAVAGRGKA